MSILDDAIRAHLELKRAHGADEAELKRLEDEAFGEPARPGEPDPAAEAPTEFLAAPGAGDGEGGRRVPNITDLQEAPPRDATPPPGPPSVEEQPAVEQESIGEGVLASDPQPDPEPPAKPDGVHTTEEREAIADQPTEFFDVEAEMGPHDEGRPTTAAPGSGAAPSPSDEEIAEASATEPKLVPPEPESGEIAAAGPPQAPPPEPTDEHDLDDDFFSEQRLSEELDNALDRPVTEEREALPPLPHHATEEGTAIYNVDPGRAPTDRAPTEEPVAQPGHDDPPEAFESHEEHEDVLEDTPEFLEDQPEDDDLWFEQKPPKDFDFDD